LKKDRWAEGGKPPDVQDLFYLSLAKKKTTSTSWGKERGKETQNTLKEKPPPYHCGGQVPTVSPFSARGKERGKKDQLERDGNHSIILVGKKRSTSISTKKRKNETWQAGFLRPGK